MSNEDFSKYKQLVERSRIAKLRIWSAMVAMLVLVIIALISFLPWPLDVNTMTSVRSFISFAIPVYSIFVFFRIRTLIKVSDEIEKCNLSVFEKYLLDDKHSPN